MQGEMCQAPPALASCQPPVNSEHFSHARCVAGCGNDPAPERLSANGFMCTGLGALA